MKKLLRSAVLTLIAAGMLAVVATPKTIQPTSPNLSPTPVCDAGGCSPW